MVEGKFSEAGFNASYNKKESIKYGIILGIISFLLGIINTIFYMIVALVFSYTLRKKNGGFWNFSIGLKSIFLMLLVSTVIATVSTMVYVHVINPGLQEEVLRNTINITIEQLETSGAPDDVIDSRVAALEEQMNTLGQITIKNIFRSLMISILMQFVFSLILSAITRNEKLSQGQPANFN
jgi:hypothetical protein